MVVWVVKVIDYATAITDVYGVYSNLALAGRAVVQSLKDFRDSPLTFKCFEEPWGYLFQIQEIDNGTWDYAEIEIGRVTINE